MRVQGAGVDHARMHTQCLLAYRCANIASTCRLICTQVRFILCLPSINCVALRICKCNLFQSMPRRHTRAGCLYNLSMFPKTKPNTQANAPPKPNPPHQSESLLEHAFVVCQTRRTHLCARLFVSFLCVNILGA